MFKGFRLTVPGVLLALLTAGCATPKVVVPSVLSPLEDPGWTSCAATLADRQARSVIDDFTLDGRTLLCRGVVAYTQQNDVDKSISLLQESAVQDKTDYRAHFLMGRILFEAKRYDEALSAYITAHRRFGQIVIPVEQMGRTILTQENRARATLFLETADQRGVCDYGCQSLLARVYIEGENSDKATAIYDKMTVDHPDKPAAFIGQAALFNAKKETAKEAGALEKAISSAGFGELTDSQQAALYHNLAEALFELDRLSEARRVISNALAIDKQAAWLTLKGDIHMGLGDPTLALPAYEQALKMTPGNGAIMARLAVAQAKTGDLSGGQTTARAARATGDRVPARFSADFNALLPTPPAPETDDDAQETAPVQ